MSKSVISKLRSKKKEQERKSQRNILVKIGEVLGTLRYTCPAKEECETIKDTFDAMRELASKKKPENDDKEIVDDSIKKVVDIIAAHPSTLRDGKCFDNKDSEDFKNVMKSIAKHCGFSCGSKRKVGGQEFTLNTVKNCYDYYNAKLFSSDPTDIKGTENGFVGDAFAKKIKEEVRKVLGKFEKFNFPTRVDVDGGNLNSRILKDVGRLSKISAILDNAVKEFNVKIKGKKGTYVMVLKPPPRKKGFWGFISSIPSMFKNCDKVGLEDIDKFRDGVNKLKDRLLQICNKNKENQVENPIFGVVSDLYDLRSNLISWIGKVSGIHYDSSYAVELAKNIDNIVKKLNDSKVEGSDMNFMGDGGGIPDCLDYVELAIGKLSKLKSARVEYVSKFVSSGWSNVVMGILTKALGSLPVGKLAALVF